MKQGFASSESIKFSADIGHAAGDHHSPDVGARLARFDHAQHSEWATHGKLAAGAGRHG
jgi:hypothetical protein